MGHGTSPSTATATTRLYFEDPDGLELELVWTPEGTYDDQLGPT